MKFIVKILWGMLGFCVPIAFKNSATHAASWVAGPGFIVTAGDAVLRANCSVSYGACTSASNNCSQFLGTIKNTMNSIVAGGYTYNGNVTNCSSGYYVSSYSPSNGHTINGARHMKSTTYGNSGCCNRSINAAFGMGANTSWYRIICSFSAQMFRDVDITDCYQSRGGRPNWELCIYLKLLLHTMTEPTPPYPSLFQIATMPGTLAMQYVPYRPKR